MDKVNDRRQRTVRLVGQYANHLQPETADSIRSMVRHGELGLAIEDLASALVLGKVPLQAGDAVDFRQLLTGFERCPDTPKDIRDLLLFPAPPPLGYFIHLLHVTDPFPIATATTEVFSIPSERIGVTINDLPAPGTPDRPAVLIEHATGSGQESTRFFAGTEFARTVGGSSELEVARSLCAATGASAMLGAHGLTPNQWVLVTGAGGHGVVMVDGDASDDGRWEIQFAYEPIEGAAELPVRDGR